VFLARKGNNKGSKEKSVGLEGIEVSLSAKSTAIIGGGVVNTRVGKSSKVLGLNHGTHSGEIGVKILSSSNPKPGEEKSAGTLPNFKLRETPAVGITGKGEANIGVSK
jgi:hypothetical protein